MNMNPPYGNYPSSWLMNNHCPVCHSILYKTISCHQSNPELIIICTSCAFAFPNIINTNEDITFGRAITYIKEFKRTDFLSIPCPKSLYFNFKELRIVYRELLGIFVGQVYCASNYCRFYTGQEFGITLLDLTSKLENLVSKWQKPPSIPFNPEKAMEAMEIMEINKEHNGNWAENDFI